MADAYTLTFLLDARRHAYIIEPSMEIALDQLGSVARSGAGDARRTEQQAS